MNIRRPEKIVVLGFLSHFPVAGVAWQTLHYLVGLEKLGFDVYYVEAHGCTPSKLMRSSTDDGPAQAADYISRILSRFGFAGKWAYHAPYESRHFGMTALQLKELYNSAALIINLHGSHLPTDELAAGNRLIFLETDPVDVQMDLYHGKKESIDYLSPHCAFFTFGENLGRPDCRVPKPRHFHFLPTRQPVVMEFWEGRGREDATVFTTIGNWRQPWREVHFEGDVYRWSKHLEFLKFIDLPRRVRQPFELALASYDADEQRMLESNGWQVRPAIDFSIDADAYRTYIADSRGEFTVAKDQNVRLRSGWFSDRAVTYLAAGRPVVTQETGFCNSLPTGAGLFGFLTMDEIIAGIESINSDYGKHRRAAWAVAREYFAHAVVLPRLLADVGIRRPGTLRPLHPEPSALPPSLVLTPTGRWPTRLPESTLETARNLAFPVARQGTAPLGQRASVIMVTFGGLLYTRMCLASLLENEWVAGDELIVVDNASTDGTREFLTEVSRLNSFVRILLNDTNRGFAHANNQGLALAQGDVLILLNNDTLVADGWREGLVRILADPEVGLVGPVTNRTCNEAQIDSPYKTYAEFIRFARENAGINRGRLSELRMLAMYCLAFRRDVFAKVGALDERFEIGMFEDDDYALRVRQAGFRVICAEDAFVHHFGQASVGELCAVGEYDRVFGANRRRFEEKWKIVWQPHGRRETEEYRALRRAVVQCVETTTPLGAQVIVISKGDDALLGFSGRNGWHFPRATNGTYANRYPADSREAVAHLEELITHGATHLVIPKPSSWWLEHYGDFAVHLSQQHRIVAKDAATGWIYELTLNAPLIRPEL